MEMNYFQRPGQSSGKLTRYANGGPDAVLFQEDQEAAGEFWRYGFELGNAFETLCEDIAKPHYLDYYGTHHERFLKKFFVSEIKSLSFGDGSHAEKIVRAVVSGDKLPKIKLKKWAKDMLSEYYPLSIPEGDIVEIVKKTCRSDKLKKKLEKEGAENQTYKNSNDLIRECADNPGKIPVAQETFATILDLAKKTCAMPLPDFWLRLWAPTGFGGTVGDFFRICDWQKEIYWDENGILKKAKPDCFFEHSGFGPMIDVKYSATIENFRGRLKKGYWIQDQHYQEGVRSLGLQSVPMLFVVGAPGDKSTPPTAQAIMLDDDSFDEKCRHLNRCWCERGRRKKYQRVSGEYDWWEKSGRLPRGFLPGRKERMWV